MTSNLIRWASLGVIAGCASSGGSASSPEPISEVFARSEVMSVLTAARHAGVRGRATYTVVVEPDSAPSINLLRSSFGEDAAARIGEAIAGVSVTLPSEPRAFLLDVVIDDSTRFGARPWRTRRPEHVNRDELGRRLAELAGQVPDGTSATLWLYVEPTGAVSRTRVAAGSGNGSWDQLLQAIAMTAVFTSCSVDDVPIGCWVELPFRISRRQR